MPSLKTLTDRFPEHRLVKKYNKDMSNSWCLGKYYLAGQILLEPDEEITGDMIERLKKIYAEVPGDIANSWEMASFMNGKNDLEEFILLL